MDKKAFTAINEDKSYLLKCDDVEIEIPEELNIKRKPPVEGLTAIWNTGSPVSLISSALAQKLGSTPVGIANINSKNGKILTPKHIINISLPDAFVVTDILVTEFPCTEDKLIIGMDVIGLGDFAISQSEGNMIFSFQVPSSHALDFVNEIDAQDSFRQRDRSKSGFKKHRKR